MARSEVESAILKTVAYFDLYQYPLTGSEIETYLFSPAQNFQLLDILKALDSLVANTSLVENQGFYFLPGGEGNIEVRKRRYLEAQKKLAIAKMNTSLIARIPYVKAIFVCNDLSYLNSPLDGDIDLTIVTSQNRIWFVRFFAALLMSILRRRPTPESRQNKICLSFLVALPNLDLSALAYGDDIHFAYWQNQQLPIYGDHTTINDFFVANAWSKKMLPNSRPIVSNERLMNSKKYLLKKIGEKILSGKFGDWVENNLKKLQLKIMPKELLTKANEDNTDVVISDTILKFHVNDTRKKISRDWKKRVGQLLPETDGTDTSLVAAHVPPCEGGG